MNPPHSHDGLIALVDGSVVHFQDAPIRLRARGAHLGDLALDPERVLRPDGEQPADLLDPRRAHAASREQAHVPKHPEGEHEGLKSAGDDPAVGGFCRGLDVDVEGLRVEAQREVDDAALGEGDAPGREPLPDPKIVEVPCAQFAGSSACADPRLGPSGGPGRRKAISS